MTHLVKLYNKSLIQIHNTFSGAGKQCVLSCYCACWSTVLKLDPWNHSETQHAGWRITWSVTLDSLSSNTGPGRSLLIPFLLHQHLQSVLSIPKIPTPRRSGLLSPSQSIIKPSTAFLKGIFRDNILSSHDSWQWIVIRFVNWSFRMVLQGFHEEYLFFRGPLS